jgi:hypothetical protein
MRHVLFSIVLTPRGHFKRTSRTIRRILALAGALLMYSHPAWSQITTVVGPETDFTFVVATDPESKATEPAGDETNRSLLQHISSKFPRFLVDQGIAQDDWEIYWSDLVQGTPADSLASSSLSEDGVARYLEYFTFPGKNHLPGDPRREHFYHFIDGQATIVVLNTNNDFATNWDTGLYSSHPLGGENEAPEAGGQGWVPGILGEVSGESDSLQYQWLAKTLEQASAESAFVFVVNHKAPFSSFAHDAPDEQQSGYPISKLDDLFHHHGVDAVFSGHDGSYERSVTTGTEAGGPAGGHEIQYFALPAIEDPSELRDPVANPTWQEGFGQYLCPLDIKNFGYAGVDIEYLGDDQYLATIAPYSLDPSDPANLDVFSGDVVQIPRTSAEPPPQLTIELSTMDGQIPPGGTLLFTIDLNNTTSEMQPYALGVLMMTPQGEVLPLVPPVFSGLPPLGTESWDFPLGPFPVGTQKGLYGLYGVVAGLVDENVVLVDTSLLFFWLQP